MCTRLSPRGYAQHPLAVLSCLAFAAVAACERGPVAPTDDLEPRMAPGGTPVPFNVIVTGAGGGFVGGAVARLIDGNGLKLDLPPTDPTTGAATALVANGDYCVSVRMAPPAALAEPVIVPDDVPAGLEQQLPLRSDVGPVLFTKFGPAAWTPAGQADCLSKTPTKHNGSSTTLEVVLPAAAQYVLRLVGPDGGSLFDSNPNLQEVVGYGVSNVPTTKRPGGFTYDGGLENGFLQFVARADRDTPGPIPEMMFGFANGQPVQIEFQQSSIVDVAIGSTTEQRVLNFTATLPTFTAEIGAEPLDLPELIAEPLFCNQQYEEFPKLNTILSVNTGFMAEPAPIQPTDTELTPLLLARLDIVPFELKVKGNEQFTVSFREDLLSSSRNTSDIVFSCSNGVCATQSQKISGGSGHFIVAFYRTLDASAGTAKATFFLTGLTVPNDRVTYSVKAKGTGEAIPIASRKNSFASETLVQKPGASSCPVQDSNDDKFFIGF